VIAIEYRVLGPLEVRHVARPPRPAPRPSRCPRGRAAYGYSTVQVDETVTTLVITRVRLVDRSLPRARVRVRAGTSSANRGRMLVTPPRLD